MDTLKLKLNAGQANSSPSLGPALGQKGINMNEFVSQYNDLTKIYDSSNILNVKVRCKDRKFSIEVGFMSTSDLIKKIAGFKKASGGKDQSFRINIEALYTVALIKRKDPRYRKTSMPQLFRMVTGTALSMHATIL